MKKAMTLGFLLALAVGASAQSAIKVGPRAVGPRAVGPTAISKKAANSTINVPPIAKPGPVAVPGKKK
jgi:hypothetical protein